MSPRVSWVVGAVAAAASMTLVTQGCKPADQDDFAPAVQPHTAAFSGRLEPAYFGHWKSTDSLSKLDLGKDGSVHVETISYGYGGKSLTKVDGKWLVNGHDLLMQYADKTHGQMVLKYSAALAGNTLTLSQASGRIKTVYKRKA